MSCRARTLPTTTGLTASRCDGFGCSERWTVPPADLDVGGGAEVVLHVARALHVVRVGGDALELGEDLGVGLLHHVHQHVEPAAMRHADGDLLHARPRAQSRSPSAPRGWCSRRPPGRSAWWRRISSRRRPRSPRPPSTAPGCARLAGASKAPTQGAPSIRSLDPGLLVRVLDVHELDADRRRNRWRAAPAMISPHGRASRSPSTLLMKIGRSKSASVKP